ncbi:MAG TPA: ABC transporter substrate-binding protein [Ferrovibrio sp.]|uniref:ABC transporter substrate-binding protein n=1 Tax=Ferrovibrio sp. TaxID=1917215 RepID=UPI002ED44A6E
MLRRHLPLVLAAAALAAAALAAIAGPAAAQNAEIQNSDWDAVLRAARGQTVYFNAWGGDDRTNAFIRWAGEQTEMRYGVAIRHVKLRDTAEAVARVVAEKAAGKTEDGSVDLIWINGPNLLAMKQQKLLYGPVTQRLPNFRLVDVQGKPATVIDFTLPVDGMAAPWAMAQIVFIYDAARVKEPPRSMAAMLDWAKAHPGRLTHPVVSNFLGATFLKQALYELTPDPAILQQPASDANFAAATAPLWAWYEALKPNLWRGGRQFPANGPAERQLMNDGEIDIMLSFNPNEASGAIADGTLPPSVRSYVLKRGTIGNASFVAIPFNAAHKEGAMVVANFLLSPEAQARMQDPDILGALTVLDLDGLAPADARRFAALPRGAATLSNAELGRPLLEPHPSWMTRIAAEWERRYSR